MMLVFKLLLYVIAYGLIGVAAGHGRTLFITSCSGEDFFQTFCIPLLRSFQDVYADMDHSILVFESDVKKSTQRYTMELMPFVNFVDHDQMFSYSSKPHQGSSFEEDACETGTCIMNQDYLRKREEMVSLNNVFFMHHLTEYLGVAIEDGYQYVAVIDSDMLFVKPLDEYLTPIDKKTNQHWDVSITYYDDQFVPPWAKNVDEIRLSKSGKFVRINSAVILLNLPSQPDEKLHDLILFCRAMSEVSFQLIDEETAGNAIARAWLDEFRGPSQAALAMLMSYGNYLHFERTKFLLGKDECWLCNNVTNVTIDGRSGNSAVPVSLNFRGIPARFLNQAESLTDGKFYDGLAMVHLKGAWWRLILPTLDALSVTWTTHTRHLYWNIDALIRWGDFFSDWVNHCGAKDDCDLIPFTEAVQ